MLSIPFEDEKGSAYLVVCVCANIKECTLLCTKNRNKCDTKKRKRVKASEDNKGQTLAAMATILCALALTADFKRNLLVINKHSRIIRALLKDASHRRFLLHAKFGLGNKFNYICSTY